MIPGQAMRNSQNIAKPQAGQKPTINRIFHKVRKSRAEVFQCTARTTVQGNSCHYWVWKSTIANVPIALNSPHQGVYYSSTRRKDHGPKFTKCWW